MPRRITYTHLKTYANAAARAADTTLTQDDVYCTVQQLDDGSIWRIGAVNGDGTGNFVAVEDGIPARGTLTNPNDTTSKLEWQTDGSLKKIIKGATIEHNQ